MLCLSGVHCYFADPEKLKEFLSCVKCKQEFDNDNHEPFLLPCSDAVVKVAQRKYLLQKVTVMNATSVNAIIFVFEMAKPIYTQTVRGNSSQKYFVLILEKLAWLAKCVPTIS